MHILNRPQTDPYFNIAAEEYLLKNVDCDHFMLWVNEPSIIVGKHQNTFAEINRNYVNTNKIPVIRRISGGGTVFHDPGNLNFTFIRLGKQGGLVDFQRFTQPIINFLNHKGIAARFEGKNDIRVNGLKVSGNAEHVYKNRVLHHGTLLYASHLSQLNQAIKGSEERFQDKAVRSVRSTVANVSDFLSESLNIQQFKEELLGFIQLENPQFKDVEFSPDDIKAIQHLADEKYKSWDWNYAYSPRFSFEKEILVNSDKFLVKMQVKNGIITQALLEGNESMSKLEQEFIGLKFSMEELELQYEHKSFSSVFTAAEYRSLLQMILQ